MRTSNETYNALILREKYPPLLRCNRVSYKTSHPTITPKALHLAANTRVGWVSLFVLVALLLAACGKEPGASSAEESFNPHPTWTDSTPEAFWD